MQETGFFYFIDGLTDDRTHLSACILWLSLVQLCFNGLYWA